MLKKLMCAALSIGMCAAFTVLPVSAVKYDAKVTGWESSFINVPNDTYLDYPLGVEIITEGEFLKSGEGTLRVYGSKDADNYYAYAFTNVTGLVSGKKYRLSGSFYVTRAGARACVYVGGNKLIPALADTNTTNKWLEINKDFDFSGSNRNFQIQMAGRGNIYADDLSICEVLEDGSLGENLLSNGDFEADFVKPEAASYVSVASRDRANYIAVKSINDAVIYEVSDGEQTKIDAPVVYSNNTYNIKVYAHSGLTNNKTYHYIVKTVASNGMESEGVAVSGTPAAAYNGYITTNQWSYKHNNSNYGTVSILKGVGRNESAGVKLSNMSDSNGNDTYLYLGNKNAIALEKDKVYKLSFWAKAGVQNETRGSIDSMGVRLTNSYCSADGETFSDAAAKDVSAWNIPTDGSWGEQVCYFKAADVKNTLEIRLNRHYEDLILDDFTLYEVDENLQPVSGAGNLLADKNGDFEAFESGLFNVDYKFYPAYSEEENFGDIMDPEEIKSLSKLAEFETDVIYIEGNVLNQIYDSGKEYTFIAAVYKDGALYDVRLLDSKAAYLPNSLDYEKVGLAYRMPDLSAGDFSVKTFIMDGVNTLNPLGTFGIIAE